MDKNNLIKLNQQQQAAVDYDAGPLLIVAGAGTGKTTVITEKIAKLILSDKCRPEEILALTFTDKAAAEMEERVDKLLPYGYVDLWISTFHSFAERILKEHGLEIGLNPDFKLLNTTEQWLLVRQNLDQFNLDYYRPLGNPTKFIHALIKYFSRAKDEEIYPADYLKYTDDLRLNQDAAEFLTTLWSEEDIKALSQQELKEILAEEIIKQEEVANAYHLYQKLLLDNNALDFGDLINYCLKLFKTRKNLLLKYQKQFKYFLVDEFQDTNYAQYDLVKLLALPQNNLTVVGDDDQSIYKFRGAAISNILQFKDDYPQSQEIILNQNYRSQQNILDLSYAFIQNNNPNRLEVKLEAGQKKFSKKLSAEKIGEGMIEHLHGKTLADEVKLTLEKIVQLYQQNKENSWSDFAILVRANASADDFIYALEQAKIPYNFVACRGLYSKQVVLDLLAYLKLLDNYHEGPAMHRLLTMEIFSLPYQDIINLNYWASRQGYSLFETASQIELINNISQETKEKIKKIIGLIAKHSALATNKKPTEIIQYFLADSGYLKKLTAIDTEFNKEQLNYLNQFYKKIENFEKETSQPTIKNFIALMELELAAGEQGTLAANPEESGPDTIKIMTIHSAKGLEFKYVFISNLVDKKFPAIERREQIELPAKLIKEIIPLGDRHLEEERRLMYVAMTRAKEGLFLTSAEDYGGARNKKLSRFLLELETAGLKLAPKLTAEKNLSLPAEKSFVKKSAGTEKFYRRFSFTQLKAFASCPYQYRFAHILNVPVAGKPAFSFGKSLHASLQKFFQLDNLKKSQKQTELFEPIVEATPVDWEELKNIYQQSFIDDWYPDRKTYQEYYDRGLAALKNFYQKYLAEKPVVRYLEYQFNLKINNEITIGGKIDRIDNSDGDLKIIDYKTGQAKSKLTGDDKNQLLIYQLAGQAIFQEPISQLAYYYLEGGGEINFLGSENDLEKIKEKIIKTVSEIKRGEFPPRPSELCKFCDFNFICEFRELS